MPVALHPPVRRTWYRSLYLVGGIQSHSDIPNVRFLIPVFLWQRCVERKTLVTKGDNENADDLT